ncbi:MAG TPA: hypothetical protein VN673_12785 [Clostridia bacterium]|nr:hypothetical protein [Clostridia bacterium]
MPNKPEMVVVLYHDDFPFEDREAVESAIRPAIEHTRLGECVDSGTMMGGRSYFDISFKVSDKRRALSTLCQKLREIHAGRSTEIHYGRERYNVYDDTLQDLGPLPEEVLPESERVPFPTRDHVMGALKRAGNLFRKKPKDES